MGKNLNRNGIIILVCMFILFYFVTTFFLNKRNISKNVIIPDDSIVSVKNDCDNGLQIVNNLYDNVRVLYDVVNNRFTVLQDDYIVVNDILYKKITNFDEVMNELFTSNGIKKYVSGMGGYFAYDEDAYYLAGNLVSYQTYYFRGDNTNIYITNCSDNVIDGIIYERWTTNYKNTLATIKVVKENEKWLIDEISILATE